jgi:hypothetical protein
MYWGVRAIAVILRNYSRKHDVHTITGVILRWAPPSENDTAAYVRAVASFTGYGASDVLNFNDQTTIRALVLAIIQHENGKPVDFFDVVNGVRYAFQ